MAIATVLMQLILTVDERCYLKEDWPSLARLVLAAQRFGWLRRCRPLSADSPVQPLSQKYSLFTPDPNHRLIHRRLVPHEGRLAIVTDAGRDAVDAEVPITNGAEADGEVVWS